jgi:hypothetical protein
LGIDEDSLQGEAYVMKRENFVQGMSKADAEKNSTYRDEKDPNFGFAYKDAVNRYANHYVNLSSRPDYDGFVSVDEGVEWARDHVGALQNPNAENKLYLNTALLDFGDISPTDFADWNTNCFKFI